MFPTGVSVGLNATIVDPDSSGQVTPVGPNSFDRLYSLVPYEWPNEFGPTQSEDIGPVNSMNNIN